jgi:hypothetical protein
MPPAMPKMPERKDVASDVASSRMIRDVGTAR